jgi:muramoyltetrapeptide carboxypeptidase LdcA involved in peptidoglycan recycling
MQKIFPEKLKKGDRVMVVAPSESLSMLSEDIRNNTDERLREMGLELVFAKHVSEVPDEDLVAMTKLKRELDHLPVVANVDFGHTDPMITFPIGGEVTLSVSKEGSEITVDAY